ncbi:PA14 domain-containing protein [Chloroflexota bacterium]
MNTILRFLSDSQNQLFPRWRSMMKLDNRILGVAVLLVLFSTIFLVHDIANSATIDAEIGGFFLPFDGRGTITQNADEGNHRYNEIDFGGSFPILAPKEGFVVHARDEMESVFNTYGYECTDIYRTANYIVLGHIPNGDGTFKFYSYYYHIAQHSLRVNEGDFVSIGQHIADTGNTGYVRPESGDGTHLHFEVSLNSPNVQENLNIRGCDGSVTFNRDKWVEFSLSNSVSIGFEEYANKWPIWNESDGYTKDSYNPPGGFLPDRRDCNPETAKVILYNHVFYGGECVVVEDPSQTFNVPDWMHVSSLYLNPIWARDHRLTACTQLNLGGSCVIFVSSIDDFRIFEGNDLFVSTHNQYVGPSWLREFSISDNPPLETDIHIVVEDQGDFDAMRVCFNGGNCQETSATELYYTWPVHLEETGDFIISVQYRRYLHYQNWDNAESVEYAYHLEVDPCYSPCDGGQGAILTSGSDCLRVTGNVSDLGFAGWGDRSDLNIRASGYDVLAYDSCCFEGPPRLIRDGQIVAVGGNVSSIELRTPLGDTAYVPDIPLGWDLNTTAYFQMDEGGGSVVQSTVGSLVGSMTGSASFVPGKFNYAIYMTNPPEGSGVNFGAVDFGSPFTVELFVKLDSVSGDQRIATQLGGGQNAGYNKWLIGLVGGRFRAWVCHINGCHEGFSLESVMPDQWYYLMLTYDGGTSARFYVDSVLQTTMIMDGVISPGTTTFELGQGEGIFGCNCTIDDVRVSNIVRVPIGPPAPTPTPIPTSTPTASPTPPVSCPTIIDWKGEYWSNDTLSGEPELCRNDPLINFDWFAGSPDPVIADDYFSARWTRNVTFEGGMYTFEVFHDDGFRFYLDGTLLFQDECPSGSCRETDSYSWFVTSGTHELKLEWWEIGGWASAWLNWYPNNPPTSTPTPAPTSTPTPIPTNTPTPTAPIAPSDLEAVVTNQTQIDLFWVDNASNESGYEIERSADEMTWNLLDTLAPDAASFSDGNLEPEINYCYRVRAFNGSGYSKYSNVDCASTLAPPIEQTAFSESLMVGSVTGNYLDTQQNDGTPELITEIETGGKPSNRYSYLDHRWIFSVQPGQSVVFYVQAWAPVSVDGDQFRFAYSTNDQEYIDMFTVSATTDNDQYQMFALPSSLSGTVYIRVFDTNRLPGGRSLDSIYVDHMYIQTNPAPGNPPEAPSYLVALPVTANQIDLAWVDNSTDENGFRLERSVDEINWDLITETGMDLTDYSDTGLSPSTVYYYRVIAYNSSGSSEYSNIADARTLEPTTIHVGDLDGTVSISRNRWSATITITIHYPNENPVAGAVVTGQWGDGLSGDSSCVTDSNGQCSLTISSIRLNALSATFTVTGVSDGASIYQPSDNNDPDGDSDGTTITVHKP